MHFDMTPRLTTAEEKVKRTIVGGPTESEHLKFANPVATSEQCMQELGVGLDKIVKTIVFKDPDENLVSVILRGSDKIKRKQLKRELGIKDLRILSADELLERTGYPVGGVPPFGFEAKFIIDSSLAKDEFVYAGGGSTHSLVYIQVSQILALTSPQALDVADTNTS